MPYVTGILLILAFADLLVDSRNENEDPCLDISSTKHRSHLCKSVYSVYLMLFLRTNSLEEAQDHLKNIKPILEPCILEENENQERSQIRFASMNQDKLEAQCSYYSFPYFHDNMTIKDERDFSVVDTTKWENSYFIQLYLYTFRGPHGSELIKFLEDTMSQVTICEPNATRIPLFLIIIDISTSADLGLEAKDEFFKACLEMGILMRFIWVDEDAFWLDTSMQEFLELAREKSGHYIDYSIENLTNTRTLVDRYGMCSVWDNHNKESDSKSLAWLVWLLFAFCALILLFVCSMTIICLLLTKTSLLDRPARYLMECLDRRLPVRIEFVDRYYPQDRPVDDEAFPRYVEDSIYFHRRLKAMASTETQETTPETQE